VKQSGVKQKLSEVKQNEMQWNEVK
jgi:hypothetical protein